MPRGKVDSQPAFVLHTYPFRETSLIAEVFSRDYGRVSLMARGARRPRAAIRGLMMGFQPLELGWVGKGDVLTLMKAEWQGGIPLLSGQALFCGYYLNELLINLLPREDAHPTLFAHYSEMLCRLGLAEGKVAEADLRWFEKRLLQELGYGLTLGHDSQGSPILPDQTYTYEIEHGAVPLGSRTHEASSVVASVMVQGQTLLDLGADNFSDPRSRAEAKQLMRSLFAHYLGGKPLHSRNIFKEIS